MLEAWGRETTALHDATTQALSHTTPLPRGALAVVVDGPFAASAVAALRDCRPDLQVVRVPGFLAAMGELSQRPAALVIGPAQALTGIAAATARALRRLAPHASLLLVTDATAGNEAKLALAHGFDQALPAPLDPHTLAQTLHEPLPPQTHNPAPDPPQPQMPPVPYTQRADNPEQVCVQDADLGDVDLVEAVLSGRQQLLPIAMRIIAAQSGIAGVEFAVNTRKIPDQSARAHVHYQGHHFGYLHAPPPAANQLLDAWAQWLSRWLAMDKQVGRLETLSHRDELTGVWNRRYFNHALQQLLDNASRDRAQVTLLVFDIDDFKHYNDRFGHAAGDEILRETARLMQSFVRDHDIVARIGGDEFAVIFWDAGDKRQPDSQHPDTVRQAARRFQQAICSHRFPKLGDQAPATLTISGGLASFPWDGRTPDELLERADGMAIQSKRQGKNAITFGPGALADGEPQTPSQP